MRAGLAEAVHHARHRQVFGKTLIDQPLMQRVLADMALDVAGGDGAVVPAGALPSTRPRSDRGEAAFARAMTPVVKYWVCKIAPALLYEAMECLGGNGYVEEAPLARYYREAPVNAIWEGSGNVMALDVLRVLAPRAGAVRRGARRHRARPRRRRRKARSACCAPPCRWRSSDEGSARILTEQLALAAAAAELRRDWAPGASPTPSSRRGSAGQWRGTYGMLDARHDARLIIDTLYPGLTACLRR